MTTRKDVVDAFYDHWRGGATEQEHYWAVEEVLQLTRDDVGGFWVIIHDLIDAAPSDEALAYLAAGPLENFVVRHGSSAIAELERHAAQEPGFRKCLSMIFRRPEIDDAVWARIREATS